MRHGRQGEGEAERDARGTARAGAFRPSGVAGAGLALALFGLLGSACTGEVQNAFDGDGVAEGAPLTAASETQSVSGDVRALGTVRAMRFPLEVEARGTLRATLSWVSADALIDVQVRDAFGYTIATSRSTGDTGAVLEASLIPASYELVVRAREGRSAFQLTVALETGGPPVCGDAYCEEVGDETCGTCELDCGPCESTGEPTDDPSDDPNDDPTDPATEVCGNGTCGASEACDTCAADCGACAPEPFCGDAICQTDEACDSCAADCGACPPPPRDPVPATAHCEPVAYFGAAATALEDRILTLVNQRRAAGASCGARGNFGAAPALKMNAALRCAARRHSLDMATRGYFAHNSLDGTTFDRRITQAGYVWSTAGENIARGPTTAEGFVNAWMASDGHCANIMSRNFKDLGVGYFGTYGTQDFAAP